MPAGEAPVGGQWKNSAFTTSTTHVNNNHIIPAACRLIEGSEVFRGTLSTTWIFISLFAYSCEGVAALPCESAVGQAVSVQGPVAFKRSNQPTWQAVTPGDLFCAGDSVRVASRSRAAILLANQTLIRLDEDTSVTFTRIEPAEPSWLDLLKGAIYFISRTRQSFKIKTPFVNAAIEGTEFVVRVTLNQETSLWVYEGVMTFGNFQGSLILRSGEAAVAEAGKAPARRIVVDPLEAVQWALYYPPVIDYRVAGQATGSERQAIKAALPDYRRNDLDAALARLDAVPETQRSVVFYTLRAGLLLTVGRVDEAQPDIDQALVLDPDNGEAYALRSIIALARNDIEKALSLAEEGARLDPKSAIPLVALSYAHQARFDIQQARDSALQAVHLSPENAMTWARLSELELSLGELDKALAAARQAVSLDPDVARTQTVLGFAHLTEIDVKGAKDAFQKAIELDQAAPLPRLGLGLATIRAGDLDDGVRELEIAASLDPHNSLIRSYLGKGYYEQKREKLAATEFEVAKWLDPHDPTPYFYDAILKQTTNRPVEALHDLQRSIELNDHRAVYRSRLLLDQDLAARSASLARIYRDLGFEQLALVEGWKSVNTDPANHSAHRLLADSYITLPRHEAARVSELLQSQLLQPINITPVQPSLAESNLLITDGAGPADLAFNEFNPLFVRNRLALQGSGVFGSNDTLGNEIVQSGLWQDYSYSLGQFHYETDGFRANNNIEQDIYNVFAQANPSPEFSVQVEYRHRELKHGELSFSFDPNAIDPSFKRSLRVEVARAGAHYKPTSHSDFIASGIYLEENENQNTTVSDVKAKSRGYIAEAQYLLHTLLFNLVAGGGYFHLKEDTEIERVIGKLFSSGVTRHRNGYLYSYVRYPNHFTWTLGVSYDGLDDAQFSDFEQINPKLGIIWDFMPSTTLRAAAFRTLKRSLLTDQTIEPTQVAGFNQIFDDFSATESKRYGIAIDHIFSSKLYGGVEFSKRDLEVPLGVFIGDWNEKLYRAYLNWAPHPRFAASVEYQFESFENEDKLGPVNTKTHLAPVSFKYFYPSGIFVDLETTYVNQSVDIVPENTDNDQFALVDIGFGYRLPKRYGSIEVQVRNVFDEKFVFQGLGGFRTPEAEIIPFLPERTIFAQATFAF